MSSSSANDDAERYSLESLGNLHGRVDFFGTKRRKEMQFIHQKMKVMQTWIFIQSFVTALLVAYLIVLSVWLAPFFPMNYDTDDETDDNTAAIRSLQQEYSSSDDQVDNNTRSIIALEDWQANHTHDMERMESALSSQQVEIDDLNNKTKHLNASVVFLQLQVAGLEKLTSHQNDRIGRLEHRVADQEQKEKRSAIATGAEFSKVNTRLDHDDTRLTKLECSQDRLDDSVNNFKETTQEKFCNMTKSIGDVIGDVAAIKEGGMKYHENAKRIYGKITSDITMLNRSVNDFKDHIDQDEIRYNEFFDNITAVEANLSDRISHLRNITGGIADTLDQTIDKAQDNVNWAIESFEEQDRVREATVEDTKIKLEAGLRKLQCSLDALNVTFMGRINDERDAFAIWVTQGLNDTKNMVTQKETLYQQRLIDMEKNMTDLVNDTRQNLKTQLDRVSKSVQDETTARETEYFHLCDQVHGLNKTLSGENAAQNGRIKTANENIESLNETIGGMKGRQDNFDTKLGELDANLLKQQVNHISLKRSAGASLAILRNETCDLNKQMGNVTSEQGLLDTRLTNAEKRTNAVKNELKQDILNTEGEFLVTIASMQDNQLTGVQRLERAEESIAELIKSLGGDPSAFFDAVNRFLPATTASLLTNPANVRFEEAPPMFHDPPREETVPDYEYPPYGEHE